MMRSASVFLILSLFFSQAVAQNNPTLVPFKNPEALYGYKNIHDSIVIQAIYDEAGQFYQGLAKVRLGNLMGIIDTTGKEVIPISYHYIGWSDDRYFQSKSDEYSLVPSEPQKIHHSDSLFYKSIIGIKKGDDWKLISDKGKIIGKYAFQKINRFTEDMAAVFKSDSSETNQYGYWGFINNKGKLVIPCKYISIEQPFKDGLAIVNYKYIPPSQTALFPAKTIINQKNKILIPQEFIGMPFKIAFRHILIFSREKTILLNHEGIIKYNEAVDSAAFLNNTKLLTYKDLKTGLINTEGKTLLPAEYKNIQMINDSTFNITTFNTWAIRDHQNYTPTATYDADTIEFDTKGGLLVNINGLKKTTTQLVDHTYNKENTVTSKITPEKNNHNCWAYTLNEKTIIPHQYEEAYPFFNGIAKVKKDNCYFYINIKEDTIIPPDKVALYENKLYKRSTNTSAYQTIYHYVIPSERYDSYETIHQNIIRVSQKGKQGIIDTSGKELIPCLYHYIHYNKIDSIFYLFLDDKIGFADEKGFITMPLNNTWHFVQPMSEGYCMVKRNGKYGFIDYRGNVRITTQYDSCMNFSEGYAAVILNKKWAFIDKHENIIAQPYYSELKPFNNGIAPAKINGKWTFLNTSGKEISTARYDTIKQTPTGRWLVYSNKLWGILDKNGKEILSPKYDYIEDFGNGYLKVSLDHQFGLTDYQENIVIALRYDNIFFNIFDNYYITLTKGYSKKQIIR